MSFDNLKFRLAVVFVIVLTSFVWILPNFVDLSGVPFLRSEKLVYGLDIQGGLHIVMGVDTEAVVEESTRRMASTLSEEMAEDGIAGVSVLPTQAAIGEFEVTAAAPADVERIESFMSSRYSTVFQSIAADGVKVTYKYLDVYLKDYRSRVVAQAIETLRNRIDEFGVAEPSITAQGDSRILVQLPGVKDAAGAKELINTTAQLKLMIVSQDPIIERLPLLIDEAEKTGEYSMEKMRYSEYIARINADLKDKIPANTIIAFEKAQNVKNIEMGSIPYLLKTDQAISGDLLKDAFVSFNEYGKPIVSLSFNPQGSKIFADLTGANVGQLMAIVLDNVVKSAPSLNEKITGGRAQITLGSVGSSEDIMKEAQTIAMSLRAGALPAQLEQLEERSIGPTLGSDSIQSAKYAAILSLALVLGFMVFWYKSFGIVASVGVFINVMMIFAALTSLRATLTLPGIAGMILTIGMAVDGNIIIFERIREELAKGTGLSLSIKEGFARALSSILDSNITTGIVCLVLISYGSGPIRGFAITLLIGIFTSVFTAVFFSRLVFDYLTQRLNVKHLSI